MRRHPQVRSLPLVLLFCTLILTVACLLLLPTPATPATTSPTLQSGIPEYVSLASDTRIFSTPSATLISSESFATHIQTPSPLEKIRAIIVPVPKKNTSPFDIKLVTVWVHTIAMSTDSLPTPPSVEATIDGKSVRVNPGKTGTSTDQQSSVINLMTMDSTATSSANLITHKIGVELTADGVLETQHFAQKLLGKTITLKAPHYTKTLTAKDIIGLLTPPTDLSEVALKALAENINREVSTSPTEPILEISGSSVVRFVAPRDGKQLDKSIFIADLTQKTRMLADEKTVEPVDLQFQSQTPKNSLSQVNTLGIIERIGLGESEYAHSIPNRVKNVSLTTSKIHAKLILPGEEFSFNKYLGEVSAKTGFLPAYVIKEGQTVLGDGGGVCQVSSTLFRAVLNSGLPITERRGHSYRVGYYEENSKPGFDATVYSPHPDFRFKNDTDTPILVNAVADPTTLSMYIELWGKSDGRKAEVVNYKQWGAQPPPPPIYQDDPTLPHGKVKQIDFAAPGLKTSFDYIVTYPDGSVKTKNFATNYIPWRAVFLRGI